MLRLGFATSVYGSVPLCTDRYPCVWIGTPVHELVIVVAEQLVAEAWHLIPLCTIFVREFFLAASDLGFVR